MDEDLEQRLRTLVDREEIRTRIHDAARGMDRHDAEVLASAYHPDATEDHGTFVGTATDFITFVNERHGSWRAHQHHVTNETIELDGDLAHAETYFFATLLRPDGVTDVAIGRYLDRFERRDGSWRIGHRLCVLDWLAQLGAPDPQRDAPDLRNFVQSTWDRSDPSYRRPLAANRPHEQHWHTEEA